MYTTHLTHAERRERRKLIADAVRNGTKVSDAARLYGVTTENVRRACHEHNVPLPSGLGTRVPLD